MSLQTVVLRRLQFGSCYHPFNLKVLHKCRILPLDLNSRTPTTTTLTADKTNDKKDHCHKVTSKEPLVAVWRPLELWCPICQENVTTKTIFKSGACTWLACTATFFLGGCFGCCLIPFCLDSCKDVFHRCPNCNFTMESFKRIK
nr:unnamed protein product [Spirometra erinaceieuropaei]